MPKASVPAFGFPAADWTPEKLRRFKVAYRYHVHSMGRTSQFTFDGQEYVPEYAKYLIEYLEGRFKTLAVAASPALDSPGDYPVVPPAELEQTPATGLSISLAGESEKALANLLRSAEKAHAASGDPANNWPNWYAAFILNKLKGVK